MQKIPRCRNSYKTYRKKYKKYHAVTTVPKPIEKNTKNTALSQQFLKLYKKYKKYHAVATVPKPIEKNTKNTTLSQVPKPIEKNTKNTTLSQQSQNL
jgi:hypothetical protein